MNAPAPLPPSMPFERLQQNFERLGDLDQTAREVQLSELSLTEPAQAAELRALLALEADAGAWFGEFESALGRGAAAELDAAWAPGRVVGPYRLERALATGGMDAVFLARKADGELQRPVALKLVPPGLTSAETVARFRREWEILAALSHPHIAQLLDAGVAAPGQPWFAMEYIDGLDLIRYCEQQHLGLQQRLVLFLELADAVQFAHRHLVVHGDIKPANVLVDRYGRVKLLDFGIARLLREIPKEQEPTRLTPHYAAPELRAGAAPSVASDGYALGVVLTELIDGAATKPRQAAELREIVALATREPEAERYSSVAQLAEDVVHFRQHRPLRAHAGGRGYRFGKWLGRHPIATGAALLAIVLTFAFTLVTKQQAERFRQQRNRAELLAGFLEEVFTGADPEVARGEELSARELLERSLARLESMPPDAALRADFLAVIGRTYQRLGDYPKAAELLEQVLLIHRDQLHSPPPTLAGAILAVAENQHLNGAFEPARQGYRAALALLERSTAPEAVALRAEASAKLGRSLGQAGQIEAGIDLLERAVALTERQAPARSEIMAERRNDLASALFRAGRYPEAQQQIAEALTIRRALDRLDGHALGSPRTATLLNNIGLMHYQSGRPEAARPAFDEALSMRRRLLGATHPDLAQTLTNLGLMDKDYGDLAAAGELLEEALAVRRRALRPDHVKIAQARHNLAMLRHKQGHLDESETLFRQALAELRVPLGDSHPLIAIAHNDFGAVLLDRGDAAAAEDEYRQALVIRRQVLPPGHPHLAWSLLGLARALIALGQVDAAQPLLQEALRIRRETLPAADPLVAEVEEALRVGATPPL